MGRLQYAVPVRRTHWSDHDTADASGERVLCGTPVSVDFRAPKSARASRPRRATMTISGHAEGETVCFWVGSTVFEDPDGGENEYDYTVWFSGLEPAVSTETTTWSSLKALYR